MAKKIARETEPKTSTLEELNTRLNKEKLKADLYWETENPRQKVSFLRQLRHRVHHRSDDHIGHPASKTELFQQAIKDVLTKPGMSMNYYDDPTDGPGGDGGSHRATTDQPAITRPGKAFKLFGDAMTLLKLVGRLGGVVNGTLQHSSRLKEMGQDPYDTIPAIQDHIIDNGGIVEYIYSDGKSERILAYHNSGGGGSVQNPLASNKLRMSEHIGDAQIVVAGHNHSRWGDEQHVDVNGDVIFTGIATGTAKGIDPERPDPFLNDKAIRPKGSGVITTHVEMKGKREVIPTLTQKQADMIWDGYDLLDITERHGITTEVIEEMKRQLHDAVPNYTFERYGRNDSRIKPDYSKNGPRTKHWEKVVYDVRGSKMPILVHFVNGLRAGSSTSNIDLLKRTVIAQTKRDPHVAVVFLRKLIAEDIPGSSDRGKVVRGLLDNLDELPGLNEKTGILKAYGVLYDEVLQSQEWMNETPFMNKLLAATQIEMRLGVPMLANHAEIIIETMAGDYSIAVHDKLGQTGSMEKPFNGLYAQERRHRLQGGKPHHVVTGGHMPVGGIRVTGGEQIIGQQTLVANGGYAEWVEKKDRGNAQMPSAPGQAVIFTTSGEMNVFPTPNFQHSMERMKVLSLEEGARQTSGVKEWMNKLGKRNGRKHFAPK